jgi:hypothetical protein
MIRNLKFLVAAIFLAASPVYAVTSTGPGTPVRLSADSFFVHGNATVSSSSSLIVQGMSGRQADLIVNITGTFTGSPTITYTLQEVDPATLTTVIGSPVSGATISAVGTQVVTLPAVAGDVVKVSWVFTGTSITGVNATLRAKGQIAPTWLGSSTPTIGQKTSAQSIPMVPASDWVENDVVGTPTTLSAICADANINSCGAGSTVQINQTGMPGTAVKFVNSTFTCTVKADVSVDGGSTWATTRFADSLGQLQDFITFTADATTVQRGIIVPMGVSTTRVRCTTTPTNTSAVTLRASMALGMQSVVDIPADSTASNAVSTACTDANIQSCATTAYASIATAGQLGVGFTIPAATTLVATIKPDCSYDGGTTWWMTYFDLPGGNKASQQTVASATTFSASILGCAGASHVRVRAVTVTSGSATISLRASFIKDPSLLSSASPGSAPPPVDQGVMFNVPFTIHSNATITTTGSTVIQNFPAKDAVLIVNIKANPTGTTPTIIYAVSEVDPGDGTTAFTGAQTITGASLNSITTQVLYLTNIHSSSIKVAYTVAGTTPSFTQVYATLIAKPDPSYGGNATGSLTVTCPNTATTANGTGVAGFNGFKSIAGMWFTKGGTGGTATVWLQYFNTTLNGWVDLAVPTAAAAATQANFRGFFARAPGTAAFTSFGTGATASTAFDGTLAANTISNGDWGDQLRLKCASGAGITAGVAQTLYWNASP